jgi:pimeloyl-ACP methyl ester carboxylesterase
LFDLAGLWSADARIEELANMLHTALTSREAPYNAIALVAHSMGGLVVQRALVDYAALREKTSHVVLFGTPSSGLIKANLFSFWKRQVRNMATTGPFIPALRKAWDDLQLSSGSVFQFVAVAGEVDQFVPPESSILPFPAPVQRVIPGNHLTMIRSDENGGPAVALLKDILLGRAPTTGPRTAARAALETKHFQHVVDTLWPSRSDLDVKAAVHLAIALDSMGRRNDAVEVLRPHCDTDSDAIGTLAGRIKRRWLVARRRADADEALRLYDNGYRLSTTRVPIDHHQAFYHGINLAFMHLAYGGDTDEASHYARATIAHCRAAAPRPRDEQWRLATLGDAHLILGDVEESLRSHQKAVDAAADPWQALSSQEQALRIADLCSDEATAQRLSRIYVGGAN